MYSKSGREKVVVLISKHDFRGLPIAGWEEKTFTELQDAKSIVASGKAIVQRSISSIQDSSWNGESPDAVDEIVRRWEWPISGGEIAMSWFMG